jgi:DNA polymerase III subunit delta
MATTYEEVMKSLRAKNYKPIYILMGEESYFIDQISNYIEQSVLSDEEKEFNQTILYGLDVDVSTIVNTAKRYPMMAEHQVVIVKEAQSVRDLESLLFYLEKPLSSTILVICYKHGVLDRRKKLAAMADKLGVLFESKKIYENALPAFIIDVVKRKGLTIEESATQLLADSVGADLNRLMSEIEKLSISMPPNQKRIQVDLIEKNIGISKEFNNFELRSAIIHKDVFKANQIINYFNANPKNNPIQLTLAFLFSFFSNLMVAYYAPNKSENGVSAFLGFHNSWQAKDYLAAMKKYNGIKVMTVIDKLREADARSKGYESGSMNNGDVMRELIYYILH